MILVKKILGLVLALFVVFSFVGVGQASAQFGNICKCAWEFPVCGVPAPTGSISCRTADDDTTCPAGLTTIGNPVCDRDGDGDGNACFNVAGACGGDPAPTTVPPTPTPVVDGYVQGRYRLMPGNTSIGETYFGSDANRIKVYLDRFQQDFVQAFDITQGGTYGTDLTAYTSRTNPSVLFPWTLLTPPTDTWTARVFVPSGKSVGSTVCYNRTDCHTVPSGQMLPNLGNTVTLNESQMLATANLSTGLGYADVYWHFCSNLAPGGLRVSPELGCGRNDAQSVLWDGLAGTVTYQLRIDDGGTWTGDANGDGSCDFQGKNPTNGIDDYCVDNIPATVSPSYVIPNGLPSGKTYRIWVHAINQCGGGTAVSTQITYARSCPTPTVPAPSATGTTVSCQNITVWKNGVRLVEPYAAIALNDRIDFKAAVSSSRSVSKIYYQVTKGTNRPQRIGVSAFCPAGGTTRNQYTSTLNLLQDVSGSYNVKYDGVDYGTCMPLVTLVP